ncbi:hypothetical protein IJI55_01755, partial [Candidatus Saccharibacteria bacterium]|nr:hypothetical protein [Candidatus Saccharibacteria bacterium]
KLTPGTYSTQVTYTAIAETPSYTISSISPTSLQYSDQTNKTITIMTTTPTSELGLGNITASITNGTNTVNLTGCTEITSNGYRGAQCTYNGSLPITIDGYNVELTSSWHSATYTKSKVFYIYQTTMQNFTGANCASLTESTTSADHRTMLQDTRDGKVYAVSKLADGNCWMVQNLALDGGRTLHTSDSNVTQDRVLPDNINYGSAESDSVAQIISYKSTDVDAQGSPFGNHYNWKAATATLGNPSTTGTIYESVCPRNWRLPDDGTNNGSWYYLLATKYGYIDIQNATAQAQRAAQPPTYIPNTGMYQKSILDGIGDNNALTTRNGLQWGTGTTQGLFYFREKYGSQADFRMTGYGLPKNIGVSVRCLFMP